MRSIQSFNDRFRFDALRAGDPIPDWQAWLSTPSNGGAIAGVSVFSGSPSTTALFLPTNIEVPQSNVVVIGPSIAIASAIFGRKTVTDCSFVRDPKQESKGSCRMDLWPRPWAAVCRRTGVSRWSAASCRAIQSDCALDPYAPALRSSFWRMDTVGVRSLWLQLTAEERFARI